MILAVDRNQRNLDLLTQFLQAEGFQILTANTLEAVEQLLSQSHSIQVALVDISGFDRTIWNYCEQLRLAHIPFLVLSPRQSAQLQQQSLAYGARSVLVKPLVIKELVRLLHSLMGE